jgi:hypothetical protein
MPLSLGIGIDVVHEIGGGPTYYVSAAGSDSNDGKSAASAWRTIAKVNATTFYPGDMVAFRGGDTFAGNLVPTAPGVLGGRTGNVTYTSYGAGQATISSTSGFGVEILNKSKISVTNLKIVGPSATSTTGVFVHTNAPGARDTIVLSGLDVSAFDLGIYVECYNGSGTSGALSGVTITGCISHNNLADGISSWSEVPYTIGITATYNISHHNGGSGIDMGGTLNSLVQFCEAYSNGATSTSGPVGIWYYDSSGSVIRYCSSHDNLSGNAADGNGFDLDGGCVNCVIEYCYSKNNHGAGYLMYPYSGSTVTNCIIRFCISVNDGSGVYGGITIGANTGGTLVSGYVHNNVVYTGGSNIACVSVTNDGGAITSVKIANNIFYSTSKPYVTSEVNKAALFQGNCYYGGGTFRWNATNYAALALWQAAFATQEKVGGTNVGITANPNLASAGDAPTMHAWDSALLAGYKPATGASPVFGAGVNLNTLYGIAKPTIDLYGQPANAGYDIGCSFKAAA